MTDIGHRPSPADHGLAQRAVTDRGVLPYDPVRDPGRGPGQPQWQRTRGLVPPEVGLRNASDRAEDPPPSRTEHDSRLQDPVSPADLGALADLFADQLRQFSSETLRLSEVFARSHGLKSAEIQALLAIRVAESRDETMTPGDLSDSLLMTSGAITGLIDRLVHSGHVRREPDRLDRRRIRLYTTRSGEEIAETLLVMGGTRTRCVVSGFTGAELDAVRRFLSEVVSTNAALLLSLRSTGTDGARSRPRPAPGNPYRDPGRDPSGA